uniref:Uncharacterized protein n=1 Tax=Oryza rufipogon TaxID=4529 RepID=A0A0E0PDT2_ORYRU
MLPPDLSGRKRWAGEPANHSSSGAPTQEKEQVDGRARWILQVQVRLPPFVSTATSSLAPEDRTCARLSMLSAFKERGKQTVEQGVTNTFGNVVFAGLAYLTSYLKAKKHNSCIFSKNILLEALLASLFCLTASKMPKGVGALTIALKEGAVFAACAGQILQAFPFWWKWNSMCHRKAEIVRSILAIIVVIYQPIQSSNRALADLPSLLQKSPSPSVAFVNFFLAKKVVKHTSQHDIN